MTRPTGIFSVYVHEGKSVHECKKISKAKTFTKKKCSNVHKGKKMLMKEKVLMKTLKFYFSGMQNPLEPLISTHQPK